MGKYTVQAGTFNQGITSLETSLNENLIIFENIERTLEANVRSQDSEDALSVNVMASEKILHDSLKELVLKIHDYKGRIMQKAIEIDKRLEEEQKLMQSETIETDNM